MGATFRMASPYEVNVLTPSTAILPEEELPGYMTLACSCTTCHVRSFGLSASNMSVVCASQTRLRLGCVQIVAIKRACHGNDLRTMDAELLMGDPRANTRHPRHCPRGDIMTSNAEGGHCILGLKGSGKLFGNGKPKLSILRAQYQAPKLTIYFFQIMSNIFSI